jgi:hypothetical protein
MYTGYIMAQPDLIGVHTRFTPSEIDEIDRRRLADPCRPSRSAYAAGLVRRQLKIQGLDPVASYSEDNSDSAAGGPK